MTVDPRTGDQSVIPGGKIAVWVDHNTTEKTLGIDRSPSFFYNAYVHVTEAFDGSGQTIIVGDDNDDDGYVQSVSVSTTGYKSVTIGAYKGYNSSSKTIKLNYQGTGSTQGKAIVILEFYKVPPSP